MISLSATYTMKPEHPYEGMLARFNSGRLLLLTRLTATSQPLTPKNDEDLGGTVHYSRWNKKCIFILFTSFEYAGNLRSGLFWFQRLR